MDKAVLVGPDIEEGRKFLEVLRNGGVQVDAALWQKDEIFGQWSLIIVTPLAEQLGVRETYRRLIKILSDTPERPAIDLLDVSVLTPEASFYKSLHRELRRARDLVVTKRPVGDHLVEAGFIYFVR
jgi:hypothetical protein